MIKQELWCHIYFGILPGLLLFFSFYLVGFSIILKTVFTTKWQITTFQYQLNVIKAKIIHKEKFY